MRPRDANERTRGTHLPVVAARGAPALVALLIAGAAFALLWHGLVHGRAQSYDSMLYARSLWGIARGEAFNPVYGMHAFGIHAQWVLYLLAPLARVWEPASVLAGAQSLAWGVTAGAATHALARHDRGNTWPSAALAGMLIALAPLVANPFLFDLRPDVLAVPLLTLGLLRARTRQCIDAGVVAWLVAALLVREEFAIVAGAALVLAPVGSLWRADAARAARRRDAIRRLAGAAAFALYLGIYWFVLRDAFAGEFADARADQAASDLFAAEGAWGYRVALLAAAFGTLGGATLLGWRWLGTALPGMILVLLLAKLPEHALNFHYAMFAAPGLIVAAVDGWSRAPSGLRGAHIGLSVAASLAFAAYPGAQRFQADAFGFDAAARAWHRDVHEAVGAFPADAGVALPGAFGARAADRSSIYSMETLRSALRSGEVPPDLDVVVLPAHEWQSLGYWLVHRAHWHRVEYLAQRFVVLERAEATATNPHLAPSGLACAPIGAWPDVGVDLCATRSSGVRLARGAHPAQTPPTLNAFARCDEGPVPLVVESGLVELTQLPPGVVVDASFGGPCTSPRAVVLSDDAGAPLAGRTRDDARPRPELPWTPEPDAGAPGP